MLERAQEIEYGDSERRGAPERFKVYLLVGEPQRAELRSHYHRALRILGTMPVASEIVYEGQADEFAARVAGDFGSRPAVAVLAGLE